MTTNRPALSIVGRRPAVGFSQTQGTLALGAESEPDPCADFGLRVPETPEYDAATNSRLPVTIDADLRPWAARFAQAVMETIGGERPASQLVRWTSRGVYGDLEQRAQAVLGVRRPAPGRPVRVLRPQVRSVHVFQPSHGSAEVSVHVRHGHRSRALAFRLEHQGDRWLCTALQIG